MSNLYFAHLVDSLKASPPADMHTRSHPTFLENLDKFDGVHGGVPVVEFLAQAGGDPRGKLVEWTEHTPAVGRMFDVVAALLNLPALQGAPHGVGGLCCVVA